MSVRSKYLILDNFVPVECAVQLRELLINEAHWRLHEESFFSQNDVSFVRREPGGRNIGELDPNLSLLLASGRVRFEAEFNTILGKYFTIVGHRMVTDQVVGVHTDTPVGDRGRTENFRLVYYIDQSFQDDDGGHLLLFETSGWGSLVDAVRPNFNSAVLMELSDSSYHAVAPVLKGTRYSLVASYWGYPLSAFPPLARDRAALTIRELIRRDYEIVAHSNTTFLYHLYNTGSMLGRWQLDAETCLAGLCHSVLGRRGVQLDVQSLSPLLLQQMIGEHATNLVKLLSTPLDFRQVKPGADVVTVARAVIEIANEIEQIEAGGDLQELEAAVHASQFLPDALRLAMMHEIKTVRYSVATH